MTKSAISTRALLEAWGYAVREFASGEEVITANDAGTAGCIVLDHNLSGMTGLELIRQLRADGVQLPRSWFRATASSLSPPPPKPASPRCCASRFPPKPWNGRLERIFSGSR